MTEDEVNQREFIEEQRAWFKAHKAETNLSWPDLSIKLGNLKSGTVSQFGGSGYSGRELPLAEAVQRYRQSLIARDTTFVDAPDVPDFFETQTTDEIIALLHWCQRGKMVAVPIGSGLGKTSAATRFSTLYPHVYIVRLLPSEGAMGPLHVAVLNTLGMPNVSGQPSALSKAIIKHLKEAHRPVLIIDEAQELTVKGLEEIRGWADLSGAGVALFGDQRLDDLIKNGTGKNALPQLQRRIKMMPVRLQPYAKDVAALAAAWGVDDARMIKEIGRVAMRPGGLGLATQCLEMAAMMASAEQQPMNLTHLQEGIADTLRRSVAE